MDILNENGEIQIDILLKIISPNRPITEAKQKNLQACIEQKQNNICDYAFNVHECYWIDHRSSSETQ